MYSENSYSLEDGIRIRQIDKKEIPRIINFLKAETDNFRLALKHRNSLNRTETIFGEVDTENIIESINEQDDTYYVFSIVPHASSNEEAVYNLEVKSENGIAESAKVMIYDPTEDWVVNGEGDFSSFSGTAVSYSLDGELESSVIYIKGVAGPCNPNPPCPDCPIDSDGNGSGSGTGGGGNPGGTGTPPTSGGMPTGCHGCYVTSSPPPTPPISPPSQPGSSVPGMWVFKCKKGSDGKLWCGYYWVAYSVNRLVNPCGGGGVVVEPIKTPCQKTKEMLERPNVAAGINDVKAQAKKAADDIKEGEVGRIEKNSGVVTAANVSSNHHVTFNDISNSMGIYHNHTYRGAKIHSPQDIQALLNFAANQASVSDYQNVYVGMIGATQCYPAAPDCYRYFHYVVRFTGSASDLSILSTFTEEKMVAMKKTYQKKESKLAADPNYVDTLGDDLNKKGLEKLFFDTLSDMDLYGKVMLQRVDDNGTINTITLDNSGMPKATPCQ